MPQSRVLLQKLLQNEVLTELEVRNFVRGFRAQEEVEGQWFDMKAGALLRDPRRNEKLRAAICGFANAEGGFLLIGYAESTQTFDGVRPVNNKQPEQWAADALAQLAQWIRPRFVRMSVNGVEVLLVAVDRSRALAFCFEDEPVYYLRFGHQTKAMPPSLVADLMLGRRARPDLRLTSVRMGVQGVHDGPHAGTFQATLAVRFENDAFVLARRTRAGMVAWSPDVAEANMTGQVVRSVEIVPPPEGLGGVRLPVWRRQHLMTVRRGAMGAPQDVLPFDYGTDDLRGWRLPYFRRQPTGSNDPEERAQARGALEVQAALYLLAEDTEPSWWQVILRYDERATRQLGDEGEHHIRFEPCVYTRPRVSLRFLLEEEPVEFT